MNSSNLPKINLASLRKLILGLILIALVFSGGYYLGRNNFKLKNEASRLSIVRETPEQFKNVDFSLFWKVWDELGQSYFDKSKLVTSKMVYGAISGMVASIGDPYTVFLPPEQNKVVEEDLQGSFSGVGIQIGYRGTQLAVIVPLPGSPAEKAGIKAGDFIIGLKDEQKNIDTTTTGMTLPDAVEAIRGKAGSEITLMLLREGTDNPFEKTVKREEINVPSVVLTFEGENKNIAYIKLLKFAAETESQWDKAVVEIVKSKADSIVLDLRNNPGGYLQAAVDLAGDFLKPQSLVVYEENASSQRNEYKTNRTPRLANYKMVILVNKGSASASEILAGALSEQNGTKIIGDVTFGKGTIQEPRKINGGAGLHITIAKWLTPKGNWVNSKGITPDIQIADKADTTEDEQYNRAVEILKGL